ncbi:hypothetical protein LWC33_13065 [Pseudonocardia sp. RS11V-5]|uniref:hypothetical protein n=1 Tax=Pseudonocardia terrae TaxID=2905831 RepID=UPI001E54C748|nr:hypothetical protein [Pseudonocardia terrae]MCE3552388.1 hypothetical protein [Pseudonocardia terrae]
MSWEALGGNPVPGDPGVALRLASTYGEVCDQAEQITSRLRALDGGSGPEVWRGQAADAFRDKLAKIGPDLITMATHYRQASEALRDFARSLDEAQAAARRAESDAGSALIDRDAAASRRDTANRDARTADGTALFADGKIVAARAQAAIAAPLDPTYQAAMQDWERRVAAQRDAARSQAADARRRAGAAASEAAQAQARVEAAKRLAAQAEAVRDDAARTAAARIKAADAPGYDDRGLWEKAWDAATTPVRIDRLLSGADDFFRDLTSSATFQSWLNIFSTVGDIVGTVGTVLSWFSFIPGVGPIAAAMIITSVALKGLAFLGTLLSVRYGNASWSQVAGRGVDLGFSALGLRGLGAIKAAKGLSDAGKPSNWIVRDIQSAPSQYRKLTNPEEAIGRSLDIGSKGYIRASAAFRTGGKAVDAGFELRDGWTDLQKDIQEFGDPTVQDRGPDNWKSFAGQVVSNSGEMLGEHTKYDWLADSAGAVAEPVVKRTVKAMASPDE